VSNEVYSSESEEEINASEIPVELLEEADPEKVNTHPEQVYPR
jgi:hypothetical protein